MKIRNIDTLLQEIYVEFIDEDELEEVTLSYHHGKVWLYKDSYNYDFLRSDILLKLAKIAVSIEGRLNSGVDFKDLYLEDL